jgi:poly-gamma-glutamate synthesis protein (capsule biosynthesis protein)
MLARALAAGGLFAMVATGVLVWVATDGPAADVAAPPPSPLTVRAGLPGWRAPGVEVTVFGAARSHERLRLLTGRRVLGGTTAGARGNYRLVFRAPSPGRYRLVVAGEGRARAAGTLAVRPVSLAAVGDITFGEQVGPAVEEYGGAYPWVDIAPTLRAADVTIGNLETSVSTRGTPAIKEFTFRGPPKAVPPMATLAGFDVLTLANNHAVDYGRDALLDTLATVRAAGIQAVGAGANALLARRPALVDAGGLRIAVLGYSDVNPYGFIASVSEPGTAEADPVAIAADVRAARRRSDAVVCFFHWGTELHPEPDARQVELARSCLDAGAQVVLGAHPHVFGRVVRPRARTLVAWTLGNFVFPSSGDRARTAVLRVLLDARGVSGYRLLPVAIDGFRPRLVAPAPNDPSAREGA